MNKPLELFLIQIRDRGFALANNMSYCRQNKIILTFKHVYAPKIQIKFTCTWEPTYTSIPIVRGIIVSGGIVKRQVVFENRWGFRAPRKFLEILRGMKCQPIMQQSVYVTQERTHLHSKTNQSQRPPA